MESQLSIKERGAHFTPTDIADFIAQRTYGMLNGEIGGIVSVLDPACGDGELLIAACRVLHSHHKHVRLIGIDKDEATLIQARERLEALLDDGDSLKLYCTDFLTCITQKGQLPLETPEGNVDGIVLLPQVDMIVANPPYVRTQVMGAAVSQSLSKRYKLTGKVDLYHAFFLTYIDYLKPAGVLGVITSNRYLYTKSGSLVRKSLDNDYDIETIIDLGDTKVFSAAVLPALLFATPRKSSSHCISCMKIYEAPKETADISVSSISEMLELEDGFYGYGDKVFKKESGHIRDSSITSEPWILASLDQEKWLDSIDDAAHCRIEDIAKVRVGVKTTADNVFIRSDWDNLGCPAPEEKWLKPLISAENTNRWSACVNSKRMILYPYYSNHGKRAVAELDDYPLMKRYLEMHYEQLAGRSYVLKANRLWYEIWVPQDPAAWVQPKIVFPDISSNARFLVDNSGAIVDGNCYWIQLTGSDSNLLYLITAVANSALMDRYHSLAFQNVLYSGKRRYLTQYVSKYPIPNPDSVYSLEIIEYTRNCIENNLDIDDARVNELVEKAFGLR